MKKNWNNCIMKGTHRGRITAKSSLNGVSYKIGWGRVREALPEAKSKVPDWEIKSNSGIGLSSTLS
jgi:hypothetical protein